jgi:hypothetical protein
MTGSDYMGKIASLPCQLCTALGQQQETRTCVHHIRTGMGKSQRASDFLTIAACTDCHQGPRGIHGDKSRLYQAKIDELGLLAMTIQAVMEQT